eukprot:3962823-Prymnesium_polylepis.1
MALQLRRTFAQWGAEKVVPAEQGAVALRSLQPGTHAKRRRRAAGRDGRRSWAPGVFARARTDKTWMST